MDMHELFEKVEAVSRRYAATFDIERNEEWCLLKLQEELGELTQAYLALSGKSRRRGKSPQELRADLEGEVADVFCQCLVLARFFNIDIEKVVADKWLSRLPK